MQWIPQLVPSFCLCTIGTLYLISAPDCPIDQTTIFTNPTSERKIVRDIKYHIIICIPQSYSRYQTELYDDRRVFYFVRDNDTKSKNQRLSPSWIWAVHFVCWYHKSMLISHKLDTYIAVAFAGAHIITPSRLYTNMYIIHQVSNWINKSVSKSFSQYKSKSVSQ